MPKAAKKTVSKSTRKTPAPKPLEFSPSAPVMSPTPSSMPKMNNMIISMALVVVVIGLATYKVGPWLVPSVVGNTPVTRFELWSRLEQGYGAQALDDMVNEKILDQAIAKANVKVDESKLSEQLKALETQFESTGGLDEALKQRGLSRSDLEKQIRTQLAVEILLADKIAPTDEEIKAQFDEGSTTMYKDKKFDEVKESIAEEIKQSKLRDTFLVWFADIKKEIKVKSFGL